MCCACIATNGNVDLPDWSNISWWYNICSVATNMENMENMENIGATSMEVAIVYYWGTIFHVMSNHFPIMENCVLLALENFPLIGNISVGLSIEH